MSAATTPQTTIDRVGTIIPVGLAVVKVYKAAAAAIVLGTGWGTPLVPTTVTHRFIGVWTETYDNTAGTAGGYYTKVRRKGAFAFAQTGTTITQAMIQEPAYFSDDHTVTVTPGTTLAGIICAVDAAGNVFVDIDQAVRSDPLAGRNWVLLSGSADAINPHITADYMITKAGVDAITLAAPTATTDDGTTIIVQSSTANAHTITATGLLQTGTASVNVATFAAHPGAGVILSAYQGVWQVIGATGITFT